MTLVGARLKAFMRIPPIRGKFKRGTFKGWDTLVAENIRLKNVVQRGHKKMFQCFKVRYHLIYLLN